MGGDAWLPADHPARLVAEFVDALDHGGWAERGVEINGAPVGAPAYHPRALLRVWVYGCMTGVRSSRKLEAACREQRPYLWLTGGQHPDHLTWWRHERRSERGQRPDLRCRGAAPVVGLGGSNDRRAGRAERGGGRGGDRPSAGGVVRPDGRAGGGWHAGRPSGLHADQRDRSRRAADGRRGRA